MHAVLTRVTISDPEASEGQLREQVVPRVAELPGFVAGYWMRKDSSGTSIVVFDGEDQATSASEGIRGAVPEGVEVESIEVREVIASA